MSKGTVYLPNVEMPKDEAELEQLCRDVAIGAFRIARDAAKLKARDATLMGEGLPSIAEQELHRRRALECTRIANDIETFALTLERGASISEEVKALREIVTHGEPSDWAPPTPPELEDRVDVDVDVPYSDEVDAILNGMADAASKSDPGDFRSGRHQIRIQSANIAGPRKAQLGQKLIIIAHTARLEGLRLQEWGTEIECTATAITVVDDE